MGAQYQSTHEDDIAITAFNFLCDGMGGIGWAGLELVAAKFGVEDIDDLMDRLLVIKMHKPPEEDKPPEMGVAE